jgi:putative DNA-invertase from lambdoid prophage Rac
MKVVIYCRVSTNDQNLNNQILELRDYCKRNSYEIVGEYCDKISGAKTSRPELDKMLQGMRGKKFQAVVVWKFDRLGRSTAHLLQVLEEMKNKNIRLIATSQNIDTDTAMGKFFFTILSGFAEMEREIITERINLGLTRAKKEGKKLGRPFGSKDTKYRKKSGYHLRWQQNKVNA